MTHEDARVLRLSPAWHPANGIRCYEAMIHRYGNHPFFLARLAEQSQRVGNIPIAERMLREVRAHLPAGVGPFQGYSNSPLGQELLGIEDRKFDEVIEWYANTAAELAKEAYDESLDCESASRLSGWEFEANDRSEGSTYYSQFWWPGRKHKFPLNLPLPHGHKPIKEVWAGLVSQDEDYQRKYLVRHAIDTNSFDDTFLLQPSVRGCSLVYCIVLKWV